jgi:endonuclease/exonuclease/phosphatase family metal-dependent hydrolase
VGYILKTHQTLCASDELNHFQGITLVDAKKFSKWPPHGPSHTFTGFEFEYNLTIDYIFVLNSCTVLHYAVLSDVWDNNFPPSDHRPVLADVEF